MELDETAKLIKELTEASGVPGYEEEIHDIIKKHLIWTSITTDKLGSIICKKTGISDETKVMLAAHMDEIGFMVKLITPEGFIRFLPLGGWFDQVLLGQRVNVKTSKGDVTGTIGSRPPHILPPEERKKVVEKKSMFIDIGASSKEEAEEFGVKPGDPIIPICPFSIMANKKMYMAKGLDDRAGVAAMIEVMKNFKELDHPNEIYGVGTVQEEVGLRGATTSAYNIEPNVALSLEVAIAGDMPEMKPEDAQTKLGKGPAIVLYDASMIPNIRLRDFVIDVCKEQNIPFQYEAMERGGQDGGRIQLSRGGVPTLCIGVPTRYIHSHVGIFNRDDFDNCVKLITEVIKRLDSDVVKDFTKV